MSDLDRKARALEHWIYWQTTASEEDIVKEVSATLSEAMEAERQACAMLSDSMIGASRHEIADAIRTRK